jgi:hypothetical protein
MSFLSPWTLARRADRGRRAVLLFALAALLYGFGLHSARACIPHATPTTHHATAEGIPCHGTTEIDIAEAACEVHCRTDVQSGRLSLVFDLPAAAPLPAPPAPEPPALIDPLVLADALPPGDTGPPLHILLHRLLR